MERRMLNQLSPSVLPSCSLKWCGQVDLPMGAVFDAGWKEVMELMVQAAGGRGLWQSEPGLVQRP